MRSSGRTMVSRTRERMLSLRRRRRGRWVMGFCVRVAESLGNLFVVVVVILVVVLGLSGKVIRARAVGRAIPAAEPRAMRAVGTEVAAAHRARFQPCDVFTHATCFANPLADFSHFAITRAPKY